MKNLNVALAEYLEEAPFAPKNSGALKAIREGVLNISGDLPALIFEILPSGFNEVTGIYNDSLLVGVVGKSNDPVVASVTTDVLTYIMAMRGADVNGIFVSSLTRPQNTKTDFDSVNNQVQYLLTFDVNWIASN